MTLHPEAPNPLHAKTDRRGWLVAFGVSLATALLIVSPFFKLGTASGHDIAFHASSWLDVAGQWKEGIVFPRWCEWANNGFGEPRFIFYPPLSWMLGAALGYVLPWNAVPGTFIVLVQTLAGLSMFALVRRVFSARAALFGAACYAGNPYALLIVYTRSDFAEELAWAFLPAMLLVALQLCGLMKNRWGLGSRAMAIFAFLFAGMWLSNAPAGVMASYSVTVLFAWAALVGKSFAPLWRGFGGLALGFGLAGFYLVPAAYEQRWVNIDQALSSGLQPAQNFLYTLINDPEHNLFNWTASNVAILLMVVTGIAALLAKRDGKHTRDAGNTEAAGKPWLALLLLSAAATFLMIRPSAILWTLLPKLRFIQFPWRWMGILAVPYAYFGAAAVVRRRARWIWLIVVIVSVAGAAAFLVRRAWWDSDDIPVLQEAIANGKGFDGTDEYDPAKDDHTDLPTKAPQVQILPTKGAKASPPKAEIRIMRWTAEEKELSVTSPHELRLAVRLLDYPAWRVEVNGRPVIPESPETTAQIILPLAARTQHIRIKFVDTRDRVWGKVISGVAGLAFFMLLLARGAKRVPSDHSRA